MAAMKHSMQQVALCFGWARIIWGGVIAATLLRGSGTAYGDDPLPKARNGLRLQPTAQYGDIYLRHNGTVWSVDFNLDGTLLATAGADGKVSVWDLRAQRKVRDVVLKEGTAAFCVRFTPQNELLISSAAPQFGCNVKETSPVIALYSLAEGTRIREFDTPVYNCHFLRLFDQGRKVIGGGQWGWGGEIGIWDMKTGKKVRSFEGAMHAVHSIAVSPDEFLVATGDQNSQYAARLWDMRTGKVTKVLPGRAYNNVVWALAFSPDGQLLAYPQQKDHTVVLWDVTKSTHRALPIKQADQLNGMLFSQDNRHLYCAGLDGTILDIDVAAGTTSEVARCAGQLIDLAMSPDGRLLAAGSFGNAAWVIDVKQRQVLGRNPSCMLLHSRFMANRQARNPRVVALAADGALRVVDARNPGAFLVITNEHLRQTCSLVQSSNLVVACSPEGKAWAMDSQTGRHVSDFLVPEYSLLAPTADGRVSATGRDQWCLVAPGEGRILKTGTFEQAAEARAIHTSAPGGAYGTRRCSGSLVELWDLEQGYKLLTAKISSPSGHYELSLVSEDGRHHVFIGFPGEDKIEAHYFRLDREAERVRDTAAKWITELGHETRATRIQAQQRLLELGPAVLPSLEGALTNDDPEVRNRATEIRTALKQIDALGKKPDDVCTLAGGGEAIGFGFFPDSARWFLGTAGRLIVMEADAKSGTMQKLASLALTKPAIQMHLVGTNQFLAFNSDTSLSLYTLEENGE